MRQDSAGAAQILYRLVEAIMTEDDETPAYKFQFVILFLMGAAKQLNIDVNPIAQLQFQSLYDKYNPVCKELINSPPSSIVAARAAAATTAILARALPQAPASAVPVPEQLALTQNSLCIQVQALRTEFEAALAQAHFPWTKNNKTTDTKFTEFEIVSTSSLIFDDVFNTNGLIRALDIIDSYRNRELGAKPISATLIAGRLSLDARLPSNLREFFSMYSSCTRSPIKSSAVESMLALHEKYKLYDSYLRLVSQPSEDLRGLLANAGYVPEQGRGWSTVTLRYIADQLGLTKNRLNNTLQETQCLHLMVSNFGLGVLVFVPSRIRQL